MASTYSTPGVYIQEISTLPASIAQVETAIPAFIGRTETNPSGPRRITSMVEYIEIFGGAAKDIVTITIVSDGGTPAADKIGTVTVSTAEKKKNLFYHMLMYFANGGGPCWVCSSGATTSSISTANVKAALDEIKLEDEPTLIVIPEAIHIATTGYYDTMKNALAQCNELQDRFVIMNTKDDTLDQSGFRTGIGTQYLKYGAVYYPRVKTSLVYDDASVKITYTGVDAAIGTALTGLTSLSSIMEAAAQASGGGNKVTEFLSLLEGPIRTAISEEVIDLGVASSMAGIYASVDRDRGVWKAPANVSLNYVVEPTVKLNDTDQGLLNISGDGKSVNAIRLFKGKGNLVWGARTLAGNDNEWKYVPVRRLFITMEESIKKATEFVVFEPNDKNTWERVRGMIESYLTNLWSEGALAGAKPEDAFFVNVGLGETMTADDILNGRLIVEIGVAAVRPAEFIVLKFSHKLQES